MGIHQSDPNFRPNSRNPRLVPRLPAGTAIPSKIEPNRSLEKPSLVSFFLDGAERAVAVGIQNRIAKRRCCAAVTHVRMVQYVRGVHSNLQALRLADLDCLTERGVKVPGSGKLQRLPAERASRPRLGILEKDLAGFRVGNRLNHAIGLQLR